MFVRRRLLLRLLRLLVAVTALFVAYPSTAAVVVDRVVLVADAEAVDAPPESDAREAGEDDARGGRTASARAGADVGQARTPSQPTRALRERAYLLHCALLR